MRTSIDTSNEIQKKIAAAFAVLRRAGFIAKNRFMCCSGCVGAEIACQIRDTGSNPLGLVFTTQQDFGKYSPAVRGNVHVKFGPVSIYGDGGTEPRCVGLDSVTIGRIVVEALEEQGLHAEWNGSPDVCIRAQLAPTPASN